MPGSSIVRYLIAKKYERLEDLHDEYEMRVRESCGSALRKRVLSEMQKFRRAGPVWWKECVEKTNQSSRLEIMNTVFEDIKQGKYTAGDGRTYASGISNQENRVGEDDQPTRQPVY